MTVFVPVHDNETTLDELVERIVAALDPTGRLLEILIVDDASTDGSWERIRALHKRDLRVRGLRFAANRGSGTARAAGCAEARGELMLTIDADLDYDPAELPVVLDALDAGHDFVSGVRIGARRRLVRRVGSVAARAVVWRHGGRRPRDLACGLQGWTTELARRLLPLAGDHPDIGWAVSFLDHARSYHEVEIRSYVEHAPSGSSTGRLALRLALLGRTAHPSVRRLLDRLLPLGRASGGYVIADRTG